MQIYPICAYKVINGEKVEEKNKEVKEILSKYMKYIYDFGRSEKEIGCLISELDELGYKNIKILAAYKSKDNQEHQCGPIYGSNIFEDILYSSYDYYVEGGHFSSLGADQNELLKEINRILKEIREGNHITLNDFKTIDTNFIKDYLNEHGYMELSRDLKKEMVIREIRKELTTLMNHFDSKKDLIVDLRWWE